MRSVREEQRLKRRKRVLKKVVAAVALILVAAFLSHEVTEGMMQSDIQEAYEQGYNQGYENGSEDAREEIMKPVQEFDIEGYHIQFMHENHPKIQHNSTHEVIGYTMSKKPGDISIRANMSKQQTYETCVHEHLHDLGIGSTYHYYINMWESQIQDPVCLEVVDRANHTNGNLTEGPFS